MLRPHINLLHLLLAALLIPGGLCDKALDQLPEWSRAHRNESGWATTLQGHVIPSLLTSLTVGLHGPPLLQDSNFFNSLANFAEERIPERVCNAKGFGAYGTFEVTQPMTQWTKAKVFSQVGKKTKVFVRFSKWMSEGGSPESVQDVNSLAIKMYTEEGILDLLGNHIQPYFIRDPILYPSLVRSKKRSPRSHLHDYTSYWDFASLRPETVYAEMKLFSNNSIPRSFRHLGVHGIHAFKMVNSEGKGVYFKYSLSPDAGVEYLSRGEALRVRGLDYDSDSRDLYNTIEGGGRPSWTLNIQLMDEGAARGASFDVFDPTKVWPEEKYPLREVGKLTLHSIPDNFFEMVEQAAFSVSNLVPGLEPSPDRLLHGRIFAYLDAQKYRLGANHLGLTVNAPRVPVRTYIREGRALVSAWESGQDAPNYFPNGFHGPQVHPTAGAQAQFQVKGTVGLYDKVRAKVADEDFSQATAYYNSMTQGEVEALAGNVAETLEGIDGGVRARTFALFDKVSVSLGTAIRNAYRAGKQH